MQEEYGLDASDRVLQKTPFSFDVSVWEFFWPLLYGSRLCVAPPTAHRDPQELCQVIQNEQVTCCHFVPSEAETQEKCNRRGSSPNWCRSVA